MYMTSVLQACQTLIKITETGVLILLLHKWSEFCHPHETYIKHIMKLMKHVLKNATTCSLTLYKHKYLAGDDICTISVYSAVRA